MSSFTISSITEFFNQSRNFYAQVYTNDLVTPVDIKYSTTHMEIRNLEELFPFVRFPTFLGKWSSSALNVEASLDGKNESWELLDEDSRQMLQIYRLFEPRFILKYTIFDELDMRKSRIFPAYVTEGTYDVQDLPDLPTVVKELFKDTESSTRKIKLIYEHMQSEIKMRQMDFPPSTDTITLVFEGCSLF